MSTRFMLINEFYCHAWFYRGLESGIHIQLAACNNGLIRVNSDGKRSANKNPNSGNEHCEAQGSDLSSLRSLKAKIWNRVSLPFTTKEPTRISIVDEVY
jgi:hypothetical protein